MRNSVKLLKLFSALFIGILLISGVVAEQDIVNGDVNSIVNKTLCIFNLGKNCVNKHINRITGNVVLVPPVPPEPPGLLTCDGVSQRGINWNYINQLREELHEYWPLEKPAVRILPKEGNNLIESIEDAEALEFFLANNPQTRFGLPVNVLTCGLRRWAIREEEKKYLVASHYNTVNMLRYNIKASMENIAAIDRYLGNEVLGGVHVPGSQTFDDFIIENPLKSELDDYMIYLLNNPPNSGEINVNIIIKDTGDLLKAVAPIEAQIKNNLERLSKIDYIITAPPGLSNEQRDALFTEADSVREETQELENRVYAMKLVAAPWAIGNEFQENYNLIYEYIGEGQIFDFSATYPTYSAQYQGNLVEAMKQQFMANRESILTSFNEMNEAVIAVSGNVVIVDGINKGSVKEVVSLVLDPKKVSRYPAIMYEEGDSEYTVRLKNAANFYLYLIGDVEKYKNAFEEGFWEDVNSPASQALLVMALVLTGLVSGPFASISYLIRGGSIAAQEGAGIFSLTLGLAMIGTDIAFSTASVSNAIEMCDESFVNPLGEELSEEEAQQRIYDFGPTNVRDYKGCIVASLLAGVDVGTVVIPDFVSEFLKAKNGAGIRAARSQKAQDFIINSHIEKSSEAKIMLAALVEEAHTSLDNVGTYIMRAKNLFDSEGVVYTQRATDFLISTEGEHPLNQIARALKEKGLADEIHYDPLSLLVQDKGTIAFIHEEGGIRRIYMGNRGVLSPDGVSDFINEETGHEIMHAVVRSFRDEGQETFLQASLRPINPAVVSDLGAYGERFSLSEITSYGYNLRREIKELKEIRTELRKFGRVPMPYDEAVTKSNQFLTRLSEQTKLMKKPDSSLRRIYKFSKYSRDYTDDFLSKIDSIIDANSLDLAYTTLPLPTESYEPIYAVKLSDIDYDIYFVPVTDNSLNAVVLTIDTPSGRMQLDIFEEETVEEVFEIFFKNGQFDAGDKQKLFDLINIRKEPTFFEPYYGIRGQLEELSKNSAEIYQLSSDILKEIDNLDNILTALSATTTYTDVYTRIMGNVQNKDEILNQVRSILGKIDSYPDDVMYPKKFHEASDFSNDIITTKYPDDFISPSNNIEVSDRMIGTVSEARHSVRKVVVYAYPKTYDTTTPFPQDKADIVSGFIGNDFSTPWQRDLLRSNDMSINEIVSLRPQDAGLYMIGQYHSNNLRGGSFANEIAQGRAFAFAPEDIDENLVGFVAARRTDFSDAVGGVDTWEISMLAHKGAGDLSSDSITEIQTLMYKFLYSYREKYPYRNKLVGRVNRKHARTYYNFLGNTEGAIEFFNRVPEEGFRYKFKGQTPPNPLLGDKFPFTGQINGETYTVDVENFAFEIDADKAIEALAEKLRL